MMQTNSHTATLAKNQYGEHVIKVSFPYNLDLIYKVRAIPGRIYHKESTSWSIPICEKNFDTILEWGFSLDENLLQVLEEIRETHKLIVNDIQLKLNGNLYHFQKEGIFWLEEHAGRGLIADEMGLGKTIQSIGWLSMHLDKLPALVICPSSVKINWSKEIKKWIPNSPRVEVLFGETTWQTSADIIVINYDILKAWKDELRRRGFNIIIIDEIHYIKSNKAIRTRVTKWITKGVPHVIGLSGTPIVNRPIEAYNAIRLIDPTMYPNMMDFARRYCNAKRTQYGWNFNGHSNTKELNESLKSIMIRRTKDEVLPDLPPKIPSFVSIELSNEEEYKAAETNFVQYIKDRKGADAARRVSTAESLVKIEGLKQLAVKGKLPYVIHWIEDFLEVTDQKLVVFVIHHFVSDELMKAFKNKAVKYDGTLSAKEKEDAKDEFINNPKIRLFIGGIHSAGEGITLTVASNVAFIELPWSPKAIDQASDRCHRIGQKDSVTIHYLLATDTIEEKIACVLDEKRKVIDSTIDGKETETDSLLFELMKTYEDELIDAA